MPRTEAQKRADAKYKASTMAQQNIAIRRETLEQFKTLAAENGDKVNTVLREAIESYIAAHADRDPVPYVPAAPSGWKQDRPSVIRTFRTTDGWQLDIEEDAATYGAWLTHSSCGAKAFLFGADKGKHSLDEFLGLVFANLAEQQEQYRDDFMR